MEEITILGEEAKTGAYLLRISVAKDLQVRFGRFQNGRPILVEKGEYIYVGSAMAGKGSMTLARRLLRHATRQDQNRPQKIRERLLLALTKAGMGAGNLQPPAEKKLFWNIDYLLEETTAALSHVLILRRQFYVEDDLAHFIMNEPESSIVVKGLGAQDKPGQTHLLRIKEVSVWWQQLPERIADL